ncbi:MAG: hypothetical protein FJ224_12175, partial [Lentisphaerae bacterium]|nr:hypothetical protein [Lentisphaerota bacterium]
MHDGQWKKDHKNPEAPLQCGLEIRVITRQKEGGMSMKQGIGSPMRLAAGLALLLGASSLVADDHAAVRFKGAPTYDLAVTNVKWESATKDYSYVTFDLSWSWSWRAK